MEIKSDSLGNRIRLAATILGISQKTISTLSGVALTVINKASRDVYVPALPVLRDIAAGLRVSEPWLAFGDGHIFISPLVFLTLTADAGKVQGSRRPMMTPRDTHDLAAYIFDAERVDSCHVVRDILRPDPIFYVCSYADQNFIILAADSLTAPGIETLLHERESTINVERLNALDDDKDMDDEDQPPALVLYLAISELYSTLPGLDIDEILQKLIESATYLLPALANRLKSLKREEIISPSQLASQHKVRLLVKFFEDLNVEQSDIERATEEYLMF